MKKVNQPKENFTQLHWLIDVFESIFSKNTVYLVITYLKFDPHEISVEFIYVIGAMT